MSNRWGESEGPHFHRGNSMPCLLGREQQRDDLLPKASRQSAHADRHVGVSSSHAGVPLRLSKRGIPLPLDECRSPFQELTRLPTLQTGLEPFSPDCIPGLSAKHYRRDSPEISSQVGTPAFSTLSAVSDPPTGLPMKHHSKRPTIILDQPPMSAWAAPRRHKQRKESSSRPSVPVTPTPTPGDDTPTPLVRKSRRSKTWAAELDTQPPTSTLTPSEAPAVTTGAEEVGRKSPVCTTPSTAYCDTPQETQQLEVHRRHRHSQRRQTWAPVCQPRVETPGTSPNASPQSMISDERDRRSFGDVDSASAYQSAPASPLHPPLPVISGTAWTRGDPIGSGSYGCVYKAMHRDTGLLFAVKKAALESSDANDKYRSKLDEELNICKRLRHPNIVSCLGHDYEGNTLYIYLEFAAGGSIAGILNEFGPLSGHLLPKATLGLMKGLHYLHTQSPPVVHRDIKGANILIDVNFCVKLADFGCSKSSSVTTSFTLVGSIPWMAPEVILQKDGHGRKADIWSVGCTVIEMATAEKPWGADVFRNAMYALTHIGMSNETPPIPETLDPKCQAFLKACLRRSPTERPFTGALLQHEYLR